MSSTSYGCDSIIIPEGVHTIGKRACFSTYSIKSIKFPSTLKKTECHHPANYRKVKVGEIVVKDGHFYGIIERYVAHGYPNEDGGVGELGFNGSIVITPEDSAVHTDWELWDNRAHVCHEILKKDKSE